MQIDKCVYCSIGSRCNILNVNQCRIEKCSFYKNKEKLKESMGKVWARLNVIDKSTQNYISNKYYGDKKPWIQGGDDNDN